MLFVCSRVQQYIWEAPWVEFELTVLKSGTNCFRIEFKIKINLNPIQVLGFQLALEIKSDTFFLVIKLKVQ